MGFSIRSELASYARLKRRCYFLFVISYGGLLAGLTYAAMTHQSPPLWIGLIPGAALSIPLLLLPTQSWLPCLFHVLLGVVFAPIICARAGSGPVAHRGRGAGRRGGAGPHLPLLYPVQYAGKRRHTQKIRPGSEGGRPPKRRRNEVRRPLQPLQLEPCSKPFRLQKNQASPRGRGPC